MTMRILTTLCLLTLANTVQALEFNDGDKILLLGNTFIERAQKYSYLETAITAANPGKHLTFRNAGWSGDTVFGHARSYFGPPREGFGRLEKLVREEKPSLILANYGANASYRGKTGLDEFTAGYGRLLDMLKKSGARIAILTPLPQEKLPAPLPDPATHNSDLAIYRDAIAQLAEARGLPLIDLFKTFGEGKGLMAASPTPLTDNGLHLTRHGYWAAANSFADTLGLETTPWKVSIPWHQPQAETRHAKVTDVRTGKATFAFTLATERLPAPPAPRHAPEALSRAKSRPVLAVQNLPAGNWILKHGDDVLAQGTSLQWAAGIALSQSPDTTQAEQLRKAIQRKNELFFHKHRPQNETYLFGFRKHEQGNNSVEIPKFQPLIEAQEMTIAELRTPKPFTLLLVRE